jgi:hypothetical protein
MMKTFTAALLLLASSLSPSSAFVSLERNSHLSCRASSSTTLYMAKYKTMDEILALFPKDKPVLINFYDAKTESKFPSPREFSRQVST